MTNYFTISEFAKLRNININSLRYYEKLGLLKPAFVDKATNYRYYSAEQLTVLDKIILCINLGIPLKEMASYIDENGNLDSQRLLEQGKMLAQNKMYQLQNAMNYIDFSLENMESTQNFAAKAETNLRHIDERRIITSDIFKAPMNIKEIVSEVAKIYKTAQEQELFPVLPAGQVFRIYASGEIHYQLFLRIMDQQKDLPYITTLPEGTYSCRQLDLNRSVDLHPIFMEQLGDSEEITLIIDNVILDKYSFGSRPSELQELLEQA